MPITAMGTFDVAAAATTEDGTIVEFVRTKVLYLPLVRLIVLPLILVTVLAWKRAGRWRWSLALLSAAALISVIQFPAMWFCNPFVPIRLIGIVVAFHSTACLYARRKFVSALVFVATGTAVEFAALRVGNSVAAIWMPFDGIAMNVMLWMAPVILARLIAGRRFTLKRFAAWVSVWAVIALAGALVYVVFSWGYRDVLHYVRFALRYMVCTVQLPAIAACYVLIAFTDSPLRGSPAGEMMSSTGEPGRMR